MKLTKAVIDTILEIGIANRIGKYKTITNVAKKIKICVSHTNKIIKNLEDKGFILKNIEGRNSNLELTEKGKKLFECFMIIKEEGFE